MRKAKYPYRIEWFRADGSSNLGGAADLDAAVKAARELRPRDAVKAVVKLGRKTMHTVALLDEEEAA